MLLYNNYIKEVSYQLSYSRYSIDKSSYLYYNSP